MRLDEILESLDIFSEVMIHETTPEDGASIRSVGFKMPVTGVFFNSKDLSYSGGGYGGTEIVAQISGPRKGILNLEDDENLPDDLDELADGNDIAVYARNNGYWAWTDGMQMAVLNKSCITIL